MKDKRICDHVPHIFMKHCKDMLEDVKTNKLKLATIGENMFDSEIRIVSVKLINDTIEVVKRQSSNEILACSSIVPGIDTTVWKEIYGIVDGHIKLINTIEGKYTPRRFVDEQIIFE